jgi:hypothetical protein
MRLRTEDWTAYCVLATILFLILFVIACEVRAQLACEGQGGIPIRSWRFPSFTACVN